MKFRIRKRYLWKWLKLNRVITDEVRLIINERGWHITAVDPAHIILGITHLPPSAFVSYPSLTDEKITLGFPLHGIRNFLPYCIYDDIVEIDFNEEDKKYNLKWERLNDENLLCEHVGMCDPSVPDLKYSGEILNLPNRDLRMILKIGKKKKKDGIQFEWIDDTILKINTVKCTVNDYIRVESSTIKYDLDEEDISLKRIGNPDMDNGSFKAIFARDYLKTISESIGKNDIIDRIRLRGDYPIEITISGDENKYNAKFILAPRIKD